MPRKKRTVPRTPSGAISRARALIFKETDPTHLVRLRDAAVQSVANPLFGSELGRLHMSGIINAIQLSAGQKWTRIFQLYQRIIGAKQIHPQSLQLGAASHDPDPESEGGKKQTDLEMVIRAEYDGAIKAIGHGSEREKVLRHLADDQAIPYFERQHAICGLNRLADFYRLTNAKLRA